MYEIIYGAGVLGCVVICLFGLWYDFEVLPDMPAHNIVLAIVPGAVLTLGPIYVIVKAFQDVKYALDILSFIGILTILAVVVGVPVWRLKKSKTSPTKN